MNCVFGGNVIEYLEVSALSHFSLTPARYPPGIIKTKNSRTMLISTHKNDALGVGEFWKQAPLDTVLGGILCIIKCCMNCTRKQYGTIQTRCTLDVTSYWNLTFCFNQLMDTKFVYRPYLVLIISTFNFFFPPKLNFFGKEMGIWQPNSNISIFFKLIL